MKLTGVACWTPVVNWLEVRCGRCKSTFHHRANRWKVQCPICNAKSDLGTLRDEYANNKKE